MACKDSSDSITDKASEVEESKSIVYNRNESTPCKTQEYPL